VEEFEVVVPDVDETLSASESLEAATCRLAQMKGREIAKGRSDRLVIAADTLVGLERPSGAEILGKPTSVTHAVDMLGRLSGKTHQVVTGVAVILGGDETVFADITSVTFRRLTKSEIEEYVASGEPMDKAGGYAIQGGAARFVQRVEGSLSNVIGLPLEKLKAELERLKKELERLSASSLREP
jgi:septum formation protein